jgi:hypothetical protein
LLPLSRECARVEYDYTQDVHLVCGRLDGATPATTEVVTGVRGRSLLFELRQSGRHAEVEVRGGAAAFTVVLPWATAVDGVEGAEVVEGEARGERLPGDPPNGVVLRATRARIAFDWT